MIFEYCTTPKPEAKTGFARRTPIRSFEKKKNCSWPPKILSLNKLSIHKNGVHFGILELEEPALLFSRLHSSQFESQ